MWIKTPSKMSSAYYQTLIEAAKAQTARKVAELEEKLAATVAGYEHKMAKAKAMEDARERKLALTLKRALDQAVARYKRKGGRGDYRPAEIAIPEVAAVPPPPPRTARPKTDWQKWVFDLVKPILEEDPHAYEVNLFSLARKAREEDWTLYRGCLDGEADALARLKEIVNGLIPAEKEAGRELRRERQERAAHWREELAAVPAGVEAAWARVRAGQPRAPGDAELLALYDEPLGEL